MRKKIILFLAFAASLFSLNSCGKGFVGVIFDKEGQSASVRTEQIISAIKEQDKEELKSLFSKKALDETEDFDKDMDYLLEFLQGEVIDWKMEMGGGDESIRDGKKSSMIRYKIDVTTDKETYLFYVIDFYIDTINADNQGVYMLEVKLASTPNVGSWQERMRAGFYIH